MFPEEPEKMDKLATSFKVGAMTTLPLFNLDDLVPVFSDILFVFCRTLWR